MTGDQRTVAELYERYGPAVYRRCLRLLNSSDAAQDATQDVFVKMVSNMRKLELRTNVLPWMYKVTTHHCLNLRRNARRRSEGGAPADEPTSATPEYSDRQLARFVLSHLDVATQAIVIAVLVDGMDHTEVAMALGVSRSTVARKVDRFLKCARESLSPAGG